MLIEAAVNEIYKAFWCGLRLSSAKGSGSLIWARVIRPESGDLRTMQQPCGDLSGSISAFPAPRARSSPPPVAPVDPTTWREGSDITGCSWWLYNADLRGLNVAPEQVTRHTARSTCAVSSPSSAL